MNISEYVTTHRISKHGVSISAAITCADGFNLSVQASRFHYCNPESDSGPWTHFEVGYVSQPEPLLGNNGGDSVWARVPEATIDAIITKHGGIKK